MNSTDQPQSGTTPVSSTSPTAPSVSSKALLWWRALAITGFILLAFAIATSLSVYEQFKAQIGHMEKQLVSKPQIKYIAVLTDAQSDPGVLVTFDPADKMIALQRVGKVVEGREDALQLWVLPTQGKPRSLGLLGRGLQTLRIPADEAQVKGVAHLGVSVESVGGTSDEHGPSGTLLFKGALIQKAL